MRYACLRIAASAKVGPLPACGRQALCVLRG